MFNKKVVRHKIKRIQAKKHKIGISLSCFDDKRFVLDDGLNTLTYFHKDCNKKNDKNKNNNHNNENDDDDDNNNNNNNNDKVAAKRMLR